MATRDYLPDVEQITDVLTERKKKGGVAKFYKSQADEHRDKEITQNITDRINQFRGKAPVGKGNSILNDVEEVKRRVYDYLVACGESSTMPSIMGMSALAFGISRHALNAFLNNHPNHPTTEFVEAVKEYFVTDLLSDLALKNQINNILTIFLLKNQSDMSDKMELSPGPGPGTLGEVRSREEILRDIESLPLPDDDD